jgi:hypothetical protein
MWQAHYRILRVCRRTMEKNSKEILNMSARSLTEWQKRTDHKALRAICREDLSKQAFAEVEKALAERETAVTLVERYYWVQSRKQGAKVDEAAAAFLVTVGKLSAEGNECYESDRGADHE